MKFIPRKKKKHFIHTSVDVGNVNNNEYKNNVRNYLFLNINYQHQIPALRY